MPINYGLFNLSNSSLVPKRRLFPVEAYMQTANERQGQYNQAFTSNSQTGEAASNMPWLPKDEATARGLQQDYQGRVAQRTADGNLEDMVYETIKDAQEFRTKSAAFAGTYAQRQQHEAELRKNVDEKGLRWTEADIQKNLAASDNMYQGVQQDPQTGQYRGSYHGISAVARPDVMKITDEAIKGIIPHKEGQSVPVYYRNPDGSVVYYTSAGTTETITPDTVNTAIAAGIKMNPATANWAAYNGQVNTAANPWSETTPFTDDQKQLIQAYGNKGYTLPMIQSMYNEGQAFKEMYDTASAYGMAKSVQDDWTKTVSGLGMHFPTADDAEIGVPPPITQGPDMYDPTMNKDASVLKNKYDTEKSVKDKQDLITRLKSGPNPDQNVIHNEEEQLAGLQAGLDRLNNIQRNVQVDLLNKHTGGKGVEVSNLLTSLDAAKTDEEKKTIMESIKKLMPNAMQVKNSYGHLPTKRPSWTAKPEDPNSLAEQIRILKLNVEDAVKMETNKMKPEATTTVKYPLAGSKARDWVRGVYEHEVANNPTAYEYTDRSGVKTKPPEEGEKLESISDMIYGPNGQRYLNGTWSKGSGNNKSLVYRMIPMNDRNSNIGRIGDQKLMASMSGVTPENPLYADIQKARAMIAGTDNEVLAPGLNPMESRFVIDPVTGQPRTDIQVQRYLRTNPSGDKKVTRFRLLDAQGNPIQVQSPGKPALDLEVENAGDLNKIISGYINKQNGHGR